MSLPKDFKQVFLALLAGLLVVVCSLGANFTSASAAPAPPAGKGHVAITFACDGKIGLYVKAFNDVEGSDPITFVLTDNLTGNVAASVPDVTYGTYVTSGIGLEFGEAYDITATGPGGYSERFHATFSCAVVTVTATPPVFTDKAGWADDTYTVPSKVGVEYSVDGVVTAAGTYPGGVVNADDTYTGTVTVTAAAEPGYVLEGTATWTHEFTPNRIWMDNFVATQPSCETMKLSFDYFDGPGEWEVMRDNYPYGSESTQVQIAGGSVSSATGHVSDVVVTGQPAGTYALMVLEAGGMKEEDGAIITIDACDTSPTSVTPTAPTFTDEAGTADDTYTVPGKSGVEYSVGGVVTAAGTSPGSGTVTVTAGAKPGYVLAGTTTWTFQFTDGVAATSVTPTAPTFTDKAGTADDTYTVPGKAGVEYSVGGVVTAAGTYPGRGLVTVTAEAKPGYVLAGTTTWTYQFTNVVLPTPTTTPTPTPSPSVTVAGVVVSAASGGQTALNPGFGAKTGWVESIGTPKGSALGGVLLLTMAGLSGLSFYWRRRTGEQ